MNQPVSTFDKVRERFERPSKTRLKQAAHELQNLGEALVALSDERLTTLSLPGTLLEAIQEFKRTRSHEGRRRQMQFIGKLMRHTDAAPIREAVAAAQAGQAADTWAQHEAERWRSDLLASDDALTKWMAEHPGSDLRKLRQLVLAARLDDAHSPQRRGGRAYRELFQFIRQASHD